MKWAKLGQIYKVKPINESLLTHASNPLPMHLNGDVYRVFYSGRNIDQKSSVGFVDINILTFEILQVCSKESFLFSSDPTSFYSHGVSIGNMYENNGEMFVIFMGWQVREGRHWRGDIGRLSLDNDKKSFRLRDNKPFLSINSEDMISLSYPWVMFDEGIYKMWYGSTINWDSSNGEMIHVIKYATSIDGTEWTRHGLAIPYEIGVAQAFSRPTVIKDAAGFHMWYSYRSGTGEKYRIGYAHSQNGAEWTRMDSGISVSQLGWDSQMICYPYVFDHKGSRYMLYNGNGFGKDGFGIAVLKNK